MSDQVAEIAPRIRESIEGGADMCATFTIKGDPKRWVQFMDGRVNAFLPETFDVEQVVPRLGGGVLDEYDTGVFVMVRMETADVHVIAPWIDAYFRHVLAARSNYSIDCTVERL
jgi:hypothetical protein